MYISCVLKIIGDENTIKIFYSVHLYGIIVGAEQGIREVLVVLKVYILESVVLKMAVLYSDCCFDFWTATMLQLHYQQTPYMWDNVWNGAASHLYTQHGRNAYKVTVLLVLQ